MPLSRLSRRGFIVALSSVPSWPTVAGAQQHLRRIAVLMAVRETDPDGQARLKALLQGLDTHGWREGKNMRTEVRWTDGTPEELRNAALHLVALKPDVIVANGSVGVAALKQTTSIIPVVFVVVNEPVAQGFITSMAHPGGNITGFTWVELSVVGKTVEILKTMAPALTRVGLMYNPDTHPFYDAVLKELQLDTRRLVEVTRAAVRSTNDIDAAIASMSSQPGGGMAILPDAFNAASQDVIRSAVMLHRLPHIVPWRQFVSRGGLVSYGPDIGDIFRRSADYVDRILKGTSPAELPAQTPTKYELAVNRRIASLLGLDVPPSLLALADEVIE